MQITSHPYNIDVDIYFLNCYTFIIDRICVQIKVYAKIR